MGILSKLIGGVAVEPITAIGNVITGIFGDKGEKLTHDEVMARIALQPTLLQTEINKVEAQHRSVFVAGWRPFIGWVCGVSLGYSFFLAPIIAIWVADMPELDTDTLYNLVLALLGLGTLRTVEKAMGRTK